MSAALRYFLLIVFPLAFIAGCSSNDFEEEELAPAELVKFEAEKKFVSVWSNGVGDGQGGIYNRLNPAIDNGVVYVASASGKVEAITLDGGKTLWNTKVGTVLSGGVGAGGGVVLLGAISGELIALKQEDGEVLWQVPVNGEILAAPQTNGSQVIVQTLAGEVIGLSIENGERLWAYKATVPVLTLRGTSTPLINRENVLTGFANGKVASFNAATGAVNWEARAALAKGNSEIERLVDIDGQLLIEGNALYAVSYQGQVIALDLASGRRLWSRDASSATGMSEGFGNVYVSGVDGSVTAFIRNGQGVRWAQTILARRGLTAPVTLGSQVVVADFEGYLHALSQVDGHIVARIKFDSDGVQSTMLVEGDVLVVYSNSGKLRAYRLEEKSKGFFSK
jgi:outer membrane protein assembly factor BamB